MYIHSCCISLLNTFFYLCSFHFKLLFKFVVVNGTLGFFFYQNSREKKIAPFFFLVQLTYFDRWRMFVPLLHTDSQKLTVLTFTTTISNKKKKLCCCYYGCYYYCCFSIYNIIAIKIVSRNAQKKDLSCS